MRKGRYTFADFVLSEMKRRDMGVREFARFVGVSHSTISKHLSNPDLTPTVDVLLKLSRATHIPFEALLAASFKEVANQAKVDAKTQVMIGMIMDLPEDLRDVLNGIVQSMKRRGNKDKPT